MAGIVAKAFGAHRSGRRAIAIGLVAALAACSPIHAWRQLNGVAKNDPGPTAPFGRELAAGEAAPYPNLGTVPPPPTREMTAAQRQRLTQSLVADRNSAQASDQKLRADYPAPPAPASAAARPQAQAGPGKPTGGRSQPGAPPAPASLEASMALPQLPPPPEPEAFTPAPPPPQLPVPPMPTTASGPAQHAPATMPAAMAAAGYQPPPPTPALSPPSLPPAPNKPARPVVAASTETIGEVDFPNGSTQLAGDQPVLDQAVAAYRGDPGHVRIVGHAGRTEGAVAQLDSFRSALDRAQAVAAALTRRGIPADKIRVEAAPAASDTGPGRAEVLLER
jgi:outer membrane protein OmpA-like peptidoglycan-associated protein